MKIHLKNGDHIEFGFPEDRTSQIGLLCTMIAIVVIIVLAGIFS